MSDGANLVKVPRRNVIGFAVFTAFSIIIFAAGLVGSTYFQWNQMKKPSVKTGFKYNPIHLDQDSRFSCPDQLGIKYGFLDDNPMVNIPFNRTAEEILEAKIMCGYAPDNAISSRWSESQEISRSLPANVAPVIYSDKNVDTPLILSYHSCNTSPNTFVCPSKCVLVVTICPKGTMINCRVEFLPNTDKEDANDRSDDTDNNKHNDDDQKETETQYFQDGMYSTLCPEAIPKKAANIVAYTIFGVILASLVVAFIGAVLWMLSDSPN